MFARNERAVAADAGSVETGLRNRWILHADMDAFYASVEQREHPEYRGKPVIVGGRGGRGVVAAASYEARVFGVRSAMPGFRAFELCPHAIFVPPNMDLYAQVSQEIGAIFAEFTPDIEPLSLDEAFLDISGSVGLFGGPLTLARRLKQRVFEATSLRISVGVAPNKLVAKIACTLSKPDGLLLVPPSAVKWLLDPLPVRRLWGVGPALAAELEQLGVRTFGELAEYDAYKLKNALGSRAPLLQRLARGDDVRSVEPNRDARSIGEENTFGVDIVDPQVILDTLTQHSHAVAQRLRRAGFRCKTISVKLKLARSRSHRPSRFAGLSEPVYPLLIRSRTLAAATLDAAEIARVAHELWNQANIRGAVRLVGVSLSNLTPVAEEQLDLFGPNPAEALAHTLDAIAARYGSKLIGPAVGRIEKSGVSSRKEPMKPPVKG